MKTTISKILLAGTFLISFTACNFLDEESETRYTAQYVFETEEGLIVTIRMIKLEKQPLHWLYVVPLI